MVQPAHGTGSLPVPPTAVNNEFLATLSARTLIEEMLARRPELLGRQNHGTPGEFLCYFILDGFVETPPDDLEALAAIRHYMLFNRYELGIASV